MFRLCSKITITDQSNVSYILDSVKNVEATTSWDTMVDTATVTLPKNIYVRKGNANSIISFAERAVVSEDPTGTAEKPSQPLFTVGDKIKIELGYDFNYNVVLEGLITDISATVPIILSCADPMWLLGRIKFGDDAVVSSPTVKDLLNNIQTLFNSSSEVNDNKGFDELSGIKFELAKDTENISLTNFSIKNKTILEIFEELKSTYYLYTYYASEEAEAGGEITARKILCGNYYTEGPELDLQDIKKFNFQNNVISEELIDKKQENVNVNIEATNINTNGAAADNLKIKVGSEDPMARTIFMSFYNLAGATEEMLKNIAVRKLQTIRYAGYSGYFTTFGKPFVKHGDTIQLIDNYLKDRNGSFKVKQVDYSFGDGGFKQKIYPHVKVS